MKAKTGLRETNRKLRFFNTKKSLVHSSMSEIFCNFASRFRALCRSEVKTVGIIIKY